MSNTRSILSPVGLALAALIGVPAGNLWFQSVHAAGGQAPPVKLTKEEDHQRIMDLLHMKEMRPGRKGSGDPAKGGPNYDEAKANPFPKLPDPLELKDGTKVTTTEMWLKQRRPEIVEDFDREIW